MLAAFKPPAITLPQMQLLLFLGFFSLAGLARERTLDATESIWG